MIFRSINRGDEDKGLTVERAKNEEKATSEAPQSVAIHELIATLSPPRGSAPAASLGWPAHLGCCAGLLFFHGILLRFQVVCFAAREWQAKHAAWAWSSPSNSPSPCSSCMKADQHIGQPFYVFSCSAPPGTAHELSLCKKSLLCFCRN